MSRACHAPIRAAVGDAFSDDEIDAMLARLSARYARLKSGQARASDRDPALWREAFESLAVEEAQQHLVERKLAAAAKVARARRENFYAGAGLREDRALRTLMVGDEAAGDRRGFSVDAQGRAAEIEATSAFTVALQEAGALERLADPFGAFAPDTTFEDDVAREIARLNGEDRAPVKDADAAKVAAIIVADQKRARERLNALGAWIGELEGYVSRTVHDAIKIGGGFWRGMNAEARAKAQRDWIAFVEPRLHERTFAATDEIALAQARTQIEAQAKAQGLELSASAIDRRLDQIAAGAIAAARRAMLSRIWTDIVAGHRAGGGAADDLDGFIPPPSQARALSRQRVLHWKDADAWIAYNRQYGAGSILNSHLAFLGRTARTEALMRTFGPAPEAAFEADRQRLTEAARAREDVDAMRGIKSIIRQAEFDQLTGAAEQAESHRLATSSRAIRQWQQLAKLGGMIFSSVTDLGAGSQALARAGVAHLKSYEGLTRSIANVADPVAKREIANLVGEGARAMAGDIAAQFTAPDANLGLLFKAQRIFYRVNLFAFWQARMRAGAGTILARHLGDRADRAFDALEPATQRALKRYGVDAGAWELLRGQAAALGEGMALTPDAAARVDGDAVAAWAGKVQVHDPDLLEAGRAGLADVLDRMAALDEPVRARISWSALTSGERRQLAAGGVDAGLWDRLRGAARRAAGDDADAIVDGAAAFGVRDATIGEALGIPLIYRPDDIADARRELALRVQSYFTDQIDTALTEPRARERAMLRLGTRTGTVLGTALELFMQFKSFPLAVLTRHLGPAFEDARTMRTVAPVAHMLMAMTALGFVAMTAKDLARGLMPMPLTDDEDPTQPGKVFLRAFIQGGGAGLYADFLFGAYDRFGRSPFAALAGPSIGELERLMRLFARLRNGDVENRGADALGIVVDNMPFANLFYTRQALNYLFLYQLQEAASPGYLRRMEERAREDRGQTYYAPPSQMALGRDAA